MLERLDFADFGDPGWMTPSVGLQFSFSQHTCSRGDGVSLGIASCHPTSCLILAFGLFFIRQDVNLVADVCLSSADLPVCLLTHLSPYLHPAGVLNVAHSGTCHWCQEFPF